MSTVAVVPVSPSHAGKFGFYSLFAYAHSLAVQQGAPAVYGLNLCGKHATADDVSRLYDVISLLDVAPVEWSIDTALSPGMVTRGLDALIGAGEATASWRDVVRCTCGRIEYLHGVALRGVGKTLVRNDVGQCCHVRPRLIHEEVLVTKPLPHVEIDPKSVHPHWIYQEIREALRKLAGTQLLISRSSERLHRTTDNRWSIDNDFLWWLYPWFLKESGYPLTNIVGGVSIVHQVSLMLAWTHMLGLPLPQVHLLPKVYFAPIGGVETPESAVARFGRQRVINALLWAALSSRKHIHLHGGMFQQVIDQPHRVSFDAGRNMLTARQ